MNVGPEQAERRSGVAPSGAAPPSAPQSAPVRAGTKQLLRKVVMQAGSSETSLSAAGCAFYATLSLFPAISSLVSVYGLVFDLQTVEPQLELLRNLLPPAAFSLIANRLHELVSQPHGSLTVGLIFSLGVAIWVASASVKSIISALNMAYQTKETRSFVSFEATALLTTAMAVLGAVLTLALMVAAPAFVDYLPAYLGRLGFSTPSPPFDILVSYGARIAVHTVAPLLMLLFVFLAVTLLYRYAPCRKPTSWRWILPGSAVATVLWVIASLGFSWYVAHFATYGATYGPLGAVAAIMMWFFVSAYVVLFGAELNVALEKRARGVRAPAPQPA